MASDASDPLAGIDIWKTPMLPPPPGVIPNFVDPPSRAHRVQAGMYSVLPIMAVFVSLRIYTRAHMTRALGMDDYLCLLSAATLITYAGLVLSFMGKPEGRHGWDIPLGEVLTNHYWLEATFSSLLVYSLSNMFTKLTLLTLYLRIFKPAFWARIAIWLGISITIIFYLATFIGYSSICIHAGVPIWESMVELRCANNSLMISKAQGWYGLISDVYILCIPLSLLWGLNLNSKRKLGVMTVFLTGFAAVGISAASLALRYTTVEQGADRTWENCIIFLYGTLELAIGLICSCMPVIAVTLKSSLTNVNLMWIYIRRYGTRLLTKTSMQGLEPPSHASSKEQLPAIPSGAVSGIRTFIRRMYRSNSQSTNDATQPATFEALDSIDQSYHIQLKQIYKNQSNV